MTVTEVVTGPDGRLYLQLRKVEEPPVQKIENPQQETRVIEMNIYDDDDEESIIQFDLN